MKMCHASFLSQQSGAAEERASEKTLGRWQRAFVFETHCIRCKTV
jgi:hypothetical protein